RNAAAIRRLQKDAAHCVESRTILLWIAQRNVEAAISFDHLRDRRSSNRRLNSSVNISGFDAVARCASPVDIDDHAGLTVYLEDANVSDPAHLSHDLLHLFRDSREFAEIVAKQLEGVFAFNATHRLF